MIGRLSYARKKAARSGFTLTEILIASALMAFLAVVTWTLFETYRSLFESGIDRSCRTRLARALAEQLDIDLHAAIQESIVDRTVSLNMAEQPASSSSAMPSDEGGLSNSPQNQSATTESTSDETTKSRRFGFFGSRHTIRFDVVQIDPRQVYHLASTESLTNEIEERPLFSKDSSEKENSSPVGNAAELRTIEYTFVAEDKDEINPRTREKDPLAETSLEKQESVQRSQPPGLMRRELRFDETSKENDRPWVDDLGLDETKFDEAELEEPIDPYECYLPEVTDLSFRYYDGKGWTYSWDSLTKKSLPVAVEITFKLQTDHRKREREKQKENQDAPEEPIEVSEDEMGGVDVESGEQNYIDEEYEDYQKQMDPPKDQYRVLITLPTSAKHPGIRAESDDGSSETTPGSIRSDSFSLSTRQTSTRNDQNDRIQNSQNTQGTRKEPVSDERWMRN